MTYVVIAPTRGVGAFFAMNAFNLAAHDAAVAQTTRSSHRWRRGENSRGCSPPTGAHRLPAGVDYPSG